MFKWKSNKGHVIYWFNPGYYKNNLWRGDCMDWTWASFTKERFEKWGSSWEDGFITIEDTDFTDYIKNFVKEVPEHPNFYFDKSSGFPRSKLVTSNYKRCTKPEKSNIIVLGKSAEITCIDTVYHIFTDSINVFAIKDVEFKKFFSTDYNKLYFDKNLGIKFKSELRELYRGRIKAIIDATSTIELFNEHIYSQPFILDYDLDNIVNKNLATPDLNSILAIKDLLWSNDPSTIKLGALMASGYNVTDWSLTFRILLGLNLQWTKAENGGHAVIIRQLYKTLKFFPFHHGSIHTVVSLLHTLNQDYSEQDIALAKDFVRTLPDIKRYCKEQPSFFLDSLPFVPDEWKI